MSERERKAAKIVSDKCIITAKECAADRSYTVMVACDVKKSSKIEKKKKNVPKYSGNENGYTEKRKKKYRAVKWKTPYKRNIRI